jgi:hypothetical protein
MERKLISEQVADKVFELSEQFNQYVFDHPEILDHIPPEAILIFLDPDDAAFNKANLELADSLPQPPGGQRVYIKMQKRVHIIEHIVWEAEILDSLQTLPSPQ